MNPLAAKINTKSDSKPVTSGNTTTTHTTAPTRVQSNQVLSGRVHGHTSYPSHTTYPSHTSYVTDHVVRTDPVPVIKRSYRSNQPAETNRVYKEPIVRYVRPEDDKHATSSLNQTSTIYKGDTLSSHTGKIVGEPKVIRRVVGDGERRTVGGYDGYVVDNTTSHVDNLGVSRDFTKSDRGYVFEGSKIMRSPKAEPKVTTNVVSTPVPMQSAPVTYSTTRVHNP